MRFQVIVRPPSANEPDIQDGIADFRLVGPKMVRIDLLQDQRDAPGGEQRFERPAVEEADDAALDDQADGAGDEEGDAAARSPATSRTGRG